MKIILSVLFILMMTGCYDGTRVEKDIKIATFNTVHFTESGMHYVAIDKNDSRSGIFVINITKDSLEVQNLMRSMWWNLTPEDSTTTNNH